MKLLILASDPMEFPGILARSSDVVATPVQVRWAREARLGDHHLLLAANGVGARRAAAAVAAAARQFRPEAVVNTGFCGALDEKLGVADLVVADRVTDGGRIAECTTFRCSLAHGTVFTADHVIQTAEEKRRLFEAGASVVEMEAAGAAAAARALGLPFYCVKAVSDLAGESLANDFNAALRPDGQFATMSILGRALRRPSVRVPELLRLRRRSLRAARALGAFFADIRF